LSAPAAHLVRLAHEEVGHMSVRHRAEGFVRLVARRSAHSVRRRLLLVFAAVLTALCLVLLARRWF
jgi:hypothetical protein